MDKISNVIDGVLIATGITISMADIHQILSIIILTLEVIWILTKLGIKLYKKIKEKRYGEIAEDIKTASDELKELDNSIKDKDSHGEE